MLSQKTLLSQALEVEAFLGTLSQAQVPQLRFFLGFEGEKSMAKAAFFEKENVEKRKKHQGVSVG